jgi:hypothetical protein
MGNAGVMTSVPLNQPSLVRSSVPSGSGGSRFNARFIAAILAAALILVIAAAFFIWQRAQSSTQKASEDPNVASQFAPLKVSLDDLVKSGSLFVDGVPSLSINGQLKVNNALVLTPQGQPSSNVAGQMYYDRSSNHLRYYDGSKFATLASDKNLVSSIGGVQGAVKLGNNLSVSGDTLNVASNGVSSVQGQTGSVSFTSGDGIAVNGTTLSNTGVLSLGGQTGALSVGSGLVISGGTLRNSGVVDVVAGNANVSVSNDGNGTITVSTTGGTGTIDSPGGTAGRIAKFTGAQTIADSLLSETGTTVTVNGNLAVTGSLSLGTLLSVANGGTGAASLANNGVLIGQGTSPIASVVAGGSGLCLMSTAGTPSFQACPGGGGAAVDSLNGLTGNLTVANSTAAGTVITIDDASTSQKGIASFSATNFSVTNGAVNTVQNINTGATPTFAGINTNSITPSAALTVGSTSQTLTLQGSNTTITRTNGANIASLTFVAPTANVVYRLQTAAAGTYDVCTTAGNCTGVGGGVTTPGGTTNSLARFTGSQTLGNSIISDDGSLVTVSGDLTVTGTTTLTTPLAVTSGGTGAATAAGARTNLVAAKSGVNSDITSLSGLTTALSVVQGGSGATSLTTNGVLLGNGTSAISSLAAGGAGLCLISTVGAPVWSACPGSGGVSSVNSQTGAVTIANASASGGTVTIDDASTSQKGIAQFNGTNFSVTSGVVNTTQDINVTAAPTFGRLTLTSSQATNAMLLVNNTNAGASGNLIDLQLNGASRLALTPAGNMTLTGTLNGQTISSAASFTGTLAVAGAANLNGGATVTGTLTANTITPSGALTVGATNQSFTLQGNGSSTIAVTSGGNTTTVAFQAPTANVTYRFLTAAAGTYDICTTVGNCAGVGGGVTSPGGTAGTIAKFTASGVIGDSLLSESGSTVTVGGTLAVNTITPSSAMTVGATGQNLTLQGATTTLKANAGGFTNTLAFATPADSSKTITLPNATGTVAVSASGPLAVDASGNITCSTCVTSGGGGGGQSAVDSINGQTGTVAIANASGGGGTVTINDASTSQKGIAQFNSTNFSASGGVINTIQDINTSAAPTFGRLTLTSSQASNDMLTVNNTNVSASGSLLKLQLNGSNRFTVDAAGNVVANGTLTSGAINGQTISSAASFTGTVGVAGLTSLNGGASVTGTLTANTITPTAAMTIGATGQSFTLQGNASSTLTATNAGSTTALTFQTPTANVTYRFLTAAAGTYDVCTTAGNCSSGIGGSGTTGNIAKFTGSGTIGNSLLSESGSTITVAGNLNLTTGSQYQINGSQISSANLSNDANLAKLSASQTFTGAANLYKNGSDSLTAFQIQPSGSTTPVFNADTTNSRVGIGTAAPAYKLDVAGDVNISTGSAYKINGTNICTASGCTAVSGSGNYIQNQNSSDQTADFRISGTGRANTALQAPLLDTAAAGTLAIGTTNATAINLNKATVVTGGFTQSAGVFSLTGTATSTLTVAGSLNLTASGGSTWQTTNGNLVIRAAGNNTELVVDNTSSGGFVRIGDDTGSARTIEIGVGNGAGSAQTVTVGGLGSTSTTLIQGGNGATAISLTPSSGGSINATTAGAGNINLTSASNITAKATTAFTVQNASSVAQLTVDNANAKINVGPAAGDTIGTLLVLGNKTNAGDPTGINGAMYYNSNSGRFRCYENSVWQNCLSRNDYTPAFIGQNMAPNSVASSGAANRAWFIAVTVPVPVTMSAIRLDVGTASGNIDVGLYNNSGTRLASSGSVACPAAGFATVNFTSSATINPGIYYLAISVDNNTATFARSGVEGVVGVNYFDTAFPLPSSVTLPGTNDSTGASRAYALAGIVNGGITQ